MTSALIERQNLKLVEPSNDYEVSFMDAAREYRDAGEELDPPFPLYWDLDFVTYVRQLRSFATSRHVPMASTPVSTFWLMRGDGTFLGASQVRHVLTPALEKEGGHIGYSIRPSQRRKGYGTSICALTIEKVRVLPFSPGLDRLLITCDTDNLASARIIEKNGGMLEDCVVSERSGKQVSRYWVDL